MLYKGASICGQNSELHAKSHSEWRSALYNMLSSRWKVPNNPKNSYISPLLLYSTCPAQKRFVYPYIINGTPLTSSIETSFPCLYNCTLGYWQLYRQAATLSYSSIQRIEPLYIHGKVVSIDDEGGGAFASLAPPLPWHYEQWLYTGRNQVQHQRLPVSTNWLSYLSILVPCPASIHC